MKALANFFGCENCDKISICNANWLSECDRSWHVIYTLKNGTVLERDLEYWEDIFTTCVRIMSIEHNDYGHRHTIETPQLPHGKVSTIEINGQGKRTSSQYSIFFLLMVKDYKPMRDVKFIIDGHTYTYDELRVLEAV